MQFSNTWIAESRLRFNERKRNLSTIISYPPKNALRVNAWRDLPSDRTPARYRLTLDDGKTRDFTLAKGNRVIMDALITQPVYCASPVRISMRVCVLRNEYSVPIHLEMFDNDAATGREKYGIYFLNAKVERLSGNGGVE